MKVLFAVSNENTSQAIIKKYQAEYKQIISYKNVYYFNAILKELQRDKTYDRIVISEDLEQYVNTDYEQMDKFLFDRLDSISDEASNTSGENIPIILICTERRSKSEQILVKLFGIGIYDALLGNDRSTSEVCKLIKRPRSKKEAKIYYKIDTDDVTYEKDDENDVSELEIQNILAHYKRIGNDEEKYVESFDSIASQYNDTQLKVISKCLPLNVRAVLEEKSEKYQEVNSYSNKISDQVRLEKREEKLGTSEVLLKSSKTKKPSGPVVIPSTIGLNKKKILIKQNKPTTLQTTQQVHQAPVQSQQTHQALKLQQMRQATLQQQNQPINRQVQSMGMSNMIEEPENQPMEVQPVKRGRGRPRKNPVEPVVEQPKRKRGRPRKNPIEEIPTQPIEETAEEEMILPGFGGNEEETMLPGFGGNEEEVTLPGFDNSEQAMELPGFEDNEQETVLPGFENEEEAILPGFAEEKIDDQYTDVLNNLRMSNEYDVPEKVKKEEEQYPELDISRIAKPNQKLVAFVGTSKNGTSFLVNNMAEILSSNGIDTAILDLTQNRNAFYIYTKNEDELREQSNHIMSNLKARKANGIHEHKNLTIYTTPFEKDENMQAVEPIIETLLEIHTVVLMDCDFSTPMRYFKYAQEIYLVQSMDILTIQPLTAFLRQLSDKGMFEESKARVVLNKFINTKEINEEILVGGISIYHDASMTVRKELFDRKTVKRVTIPFELKSYLRYLDGLVTCDVSLRGYTKEFLQSLRRLASMIYESGNKKEKYAPPSIKNNNANNGFSAKMNNTLNQMKKNY